MWILLLAIALIIALMVNLWQAIARPFIVINFIDSPDRGLLTQSDRSTLDRPRRDCRGEAFGREKS
jgi:hypothetical protein